MKDFILEIAFDDAATEDLVHARLFTTASTGSYSNEAGGRTTVFAYFDSARARDAAATALTDLPVRVVSSEKERLDWLEIYQQSLEPMFIGSRFVVAPDASLIPENSSLLRLVIPQEQAFGTGSHETTSLCLEILESMVLDGKRGLDVGSGSGILALAMLRLGASKVLAFDNDVDAFGALRDNRSRNGIVESAMPLFIGSIDALRGGAFDVVTMNILPDVIIALLVDVVAHVAVAGSLVLSGILSSRCDEVVRAAAIRGLHLVDEREKGEWWAGVFRRK